MGFCSINFAYCFILLLGSFSFGYVISYPSPAIPEIKKIINIKDSESTIFNAISSLFAIIGSILSTFMIRLVDKKITLFITSLIGAIFWVSLSFMIISNIWLGIFGRMVLGIFMGSISVVVPLCIHDLTPPKYKGIYGSLSQLGICIGCTVVYFLAEAMNWRSLTYFDGSICALLCVLIWIVPLQSKKQNENKDINSIKEIEDEEEEEKVKEENESIFQRKYMKNLFIGIGAMFFQQFSGCIGILSNLNTLFEQSKIPLSSSIASGIASSAQVIAVIIGGFLIQFLGRRFVWILSCVCDAISILIYGLTIKISSCPSLIAIIAIFIYLLGYGCGLGPIPWFIVPQLFQESVRSTATSIAAACNWIFAFTVNLCFPYLIQSIGEFFSMIIFMTICIFGSFFGFFFIGEKNNENLSENNC